MSSYLSYFLTPSIFLNGPMIVAASIGLTIAFRTRLSAVPRRVLFFLSGLSLGGILQTTLLREPPRGACIECLSQWPVERLASGQVGLDTALNVALFVPLGLFATLLWKTPFRVTAVAALISLTVESIQPLLGVGTNDIADITANSFGTFVGAGLATTILLIHDTVVDRNLDLRRLTKLLMTTAISLGLVLGISIGGANSIQTSGGQQLVAMFAGTSLADYRHNETAWLPRFEAFWKSNRTPTADAYSDNNVALQRFTWTFYWTTRCVTARWDTHGFTTELADSSRCRQPLQ